MTVIVPIGTNWFHITLNQLFLGKITVMVPIGTNGFHITLNQLFLSQNNSHSTNWNQLIPYYLKSAVFIPK